MLLLVGMVVVDGMPALASEWMPNGTMNEYLKAHEGVDVAELVRTASILLKVSLPLTLTLGEWNRIWSGIPP